MTFRTLKPFQKAYEKKIEHQIDNINFQAWLSGRYIAEAIATVFSKKAKYPKEPYELRPKKELAQQDVHPDVRNFMAFANALNATRLSQ